MKTKQRITLKMDEDIVKTLKVLSQEKGMFLSVFVENIIREGLTYVG